MTTLVKRGTARRLGLHQVQHGQPEVPEWIRQLSQPFVAMAEAMRAVAWPPPGMPGSDKGMR